MKTVVIFGHRSGTSLLSSVLNHAGIWMGKEFYGPNDFNKGGYWENMDFFHVNNLILGKAGGDKTFNLPNPDEVEKLKDDSEVQAEIKDVIKKHAKEPIWGFKHPATCLTAKLWHPHLPDPHYIYCVRDPNEIAASFRRCNPQEVKKGDNWWFVNKVIPFANRAREFLRDKKWIQVEFDDLLYDSEKTFKKTFKFLNYKVDKYVLAECVGLVNPHWRTFGGK